jgi:DNA-binding SARP family transcriptional activator
MSTLRIHLLGTMQISIDDLPGEIRLTPVIQGLLAYLLLNFDRPQRRDVLADLFWANYSQEHARSCLNTALWRLRRTLDPDGIYLTSTPQGEVMFNLNSPYWLDVQIFMEQVRPLLELPADQVTPDDVASAEQSLSLYKGDLLPGFYSDWVIRQRERLRMIYLKTLSNLAYYYEKLGNVERSLSYAWRILDLDPLREDVHREVMRLQVACGQRATAIKQFETCCAILREGLGVGPMEETRRLYQEILGEDGLPAGELQEPTSASLAQVLSQLRRSRESFEQAQEQIQIAIHMVESLTIHK